MRTVKRETGGASLTNEYVINKPVTVVPKVVDVGENENGAVMFYLDNNEAMTKLRYISMYGEPMPEKKGEIKHQHYKGPNPDRTKINFKK